MNSQVYPLPQRTEAESHLAAPRSDTDLIGGGRRDAALPIGEMLVAAGKLTEDDVQLVLDYQVRSHQPFGETAVTLGLLDVEDVRQAVADQFGHVVPAPQTSVVSELLAATDPDSAAVEHLRALRSQLMLRWFENDQRQGALAVVSPGAGEGRSWITANLAVLLAQLGKRTIVIDADLRRPRQHRIFGVPGRVGLSAVLAGRAGWEAVVDIPEIPGLSLLPAGAIPPNPQELLGRPGFVRVMASLRAKYEVILLDTPAAESCADVGTIAARAGAALVVACQDRSSAARLASLSEDLRQFGVTIVGGVLNGAAERTRGH